jgi:hypothetical protein
MSLSAGKKSGAAMMIVAAIAILFLLPATAGAATGRSVAVTASATIKVPNDTATLGFGVKRERKTRGAALSATAAALRKVIATAQAFPGVGEGDIHTGRIDVSPIQQGKVTVYRATEGASVILHEPSKAGELVSAVIAAGATGINGPTFGVGNQEAAFGTGSDTRDPSRGAARPGADDRRRRRGPDRRAGREGRVHRPHAGRDAADQARHLDGQGDRPRRLRTHLAFSFAST